MHLCDRVFVFVCGGALRAGALSLTEMSLLCAQVKKANENVLLYVNIEREVR